MKKHFYSLLWIVFTINYSAFSQITLTPNANYAGTSFGITITGIGTNFIATATTCASVNGIGPITGGGATSETSFMGTLTIPPGTPPGSYGATIYQEFCDGISWSCNNCFTVNAGIIQSVSPGNGAQGNSVNISVTGLGTSFNAGVTSCAQISGNGESYQIIGNASSPTQFTGLLDLPCDASVGSYNLTVFAEPGCMGASWSCFDCFSVTASGAPSIGVMPMSGNLGAISNLTITGTNTCFIPGTTTCGEFVSSTGISYPITGSASSSNNFSGTVDLNCLAEAGPYDILIYVDGCSGTDIFDCTDCFIVNPLSGGSISLNLAAAERGRMFNLDITGIGTCFETGTTDCVELSNSGTSYFLGGSATATNSFDANAFTFPCNAPLGTYDVTIYQEAGCNGFSWSCSDCLTVNDPTIPIKLPLDAAVRGATTNLTIEGICTDFLIASTDCAVITNGTNTYQIDGSASSSTDFAGTLVLPADAPKGSYSAEIYQEAGCTGTSWSCTNCFSIIDSISISPGEGLRGRMIELTVTGQNTEFDLTTTTCLELSSNGNTYSITNGLATTPTKFSVDFDLTSANIVAGSYDAKIYEGTGCTGRYWSCTDCFTIKDSISVSPANEDPGNTVNLTITGEDTDFQAGVTNCVEVTNGSVTYTFNGTAADALSFSGNFNVPIDAPFGNYDVIIYQGADCTGVEWSCYNCFEVSGAPLPIDWLYIRAEQVAKEIAVYWGSAAERNTDVFVIERSSDGKQWQAIGQRDAAGFSSRNIDYHFIDKYPLTGNNYYQIKQYDLDGEFELSEVVVIPFRDVIYDLIVAPNPVYEMANLQFTIDQDRPVKIKVMNCAGQLQLVDEQLFEKGDHNFELDMQGWTKGIYILSVESNEKVQIRKLVKL